MLQQSYHFSYDTQLEDYFETAFEVMAYLRWKNNSKLAYDPTYEKIEHGKLQECYWLEFFSDAEVRICLISPKARGNEVDL